MAGNWIVRDVRHLEHGVSDVERLGLSGIAGAQLTARAPVLGRRATRATSRAITAIVLEVRKAPVRPGMNSPGTAPAAYTEAITARPTAPPSCWAVWSSPEADPACSGSTPRRTVEVTGMKTRPAAKPLSSIGPRIVLE